MNSTLSNIHANKLAKYNYKYIDSNGDVYIGTKQGRLTKYVTPVALTNLTDIALTNTELNNTITNLIQELNISPFLLMGG